MVLRAKTSPTDSFLLESSTFPPDSTSLSLARPRPLVPSPSPIPTAQTASSSTASKSSLDEFRGTPYIQWDLRVSRPFTIKERFTATPFIEFFNIFNRNNPGANYVTNVAAFPVPVNDVSNITGICANPPACSAFTPITSLKQLSFPAGALGDFFGPGTTVGTGSQLKSAAVSRFSARTRTAIFLAECSLVM